MTQPLAFIVYERLLPGTQLVNRLQDLKYRVRALTDAGALRASAQQEKPMVVLADLGSNRDEMCEAIRQMKQSPDTQHIPVIAFAAEEDAAGLEATAREAGVALMVTDTAVLNHLPQLLEQALRVE